MSFNYPLGLLALLAIPVLVIIYIIKNKYTEQVVASTYLWTLSERFLKRKNPINRITGIISLILQILAVIFIAFAIAQPVFTINGAAQDYVFIVDGSGSMNLEISGETRLERAKGEVSSLISSSANGSTYTIVYATETADVICEDVSTKSAALTKLESIEPAYGTMGTTAAMTKAQEVFDENPAVKIYFVTDKDYGTTENVTIINVSNNETNYAVSDVAYEKTSTSLEITADIWSYSGDANLTVALYVDGSAEAAQTVSVSVTQLEASTISFSYGSVSFDSFTIKILEDDGLAADNETTVYGSTSDDSNTILVVSDAPFFISSVFSTVSNVVVTVVSTSEYTGETGYSLYVFDNYSPGGNGYNVPSDGAVWFINPVTSDDNTGFSVQSTDNELSSPGALVYSSSTSSRVRELLSGTSGETIYISKYVKCGFYRSFYTLLSYNGNAMLFAGTNSYGNREVVFAFDLHDSDITLTPDYVVLVNNLLSYTFPDIVSETSYYCGDTVTINVLSGCESITVQSPLGNISYIEASSDYAELTLSEVGTYIITLDNGKGTVKLYSNIAKDERYTIAEGDYFVVSGEASTETRDGIYDDLLYLFIILAVLFIADWGVYCYEQYQLR